MSSDAKKITPPRWATRVLLTFLRDDLAEEVLGDLQEKLDANIAAGQSTFAARRNYWYQVLNYLRPFAIRKRSPHYFANHAMLQNYSKITFRNLTKQKLYSGINIGGLAIGLTAFLLIALYVQHEFSFDRFFKNGDKIYRVYQRQAGNVHMNTDYFAVTPALLARALMDEYPEVTKATTVGQEGAFLSVDAHRYWEDGLYADEHFFEVLSFPFVSGNPSKALGLNSIVLTQTLAHTLFGSKDPIGQLVEYNKGSTLTVTGVVNDPPANSSIRFSFVVNIFSIEWAASELKKTKWSNNSFFTFFVLADGASPEALQQKLPALLPKYRDEEDYANYAFQDEYFVQPIADLHLQNNVNGDIGIRGSTTFVCLFSGVALLILLLACINYMNLAVARSINRAREVGLRKVVGAVRGQLIVQFLGESVIIAFLGLLIATGLTYLLLPYFSGLVDRTLSFNMLENNLLWPGLLLLVVIVGLLSGSYPALIMSSLEPVLVLKGKAQGLARSGMQRWLMVGQFTISSVLVIGSIVIYEQLQYIREKELGFDRDHVVIIQPKDHALIEHADALFQEWSTNPHIRSAAITQQLPTNVQSSTIINDDTPTKEDDVAIYESRVSYDYLKVFGIKLIAGRNFSRDVTTDLEEGYLINETAAKALGWTPDEAIGKQFTHEGAETVIGVVKDFHMHSMHLAVQPLMIRLRHPNWWGALAIKVDGENLPKTIAYLEGTVKKISPFPFEYQFLDDNFNQLYKSDARMGEIFGFFTVLSLIIAALGLFGLAAFTSGQRTKEIGIRKVLGASVRNIVMLLMKDFLILVVVAFVISVPIAWYSTHQWLQSFAYRVELTWWMFGGAGLLAILVANMAISYQSLKASLTNPVKSLRSE